MFQDGRRRWGASVALFAGAGAGLVALGVWMFRRGARRRARRGLVVERTVTIDRPIEEVWAYWASYENLARFMRHVHRVEDRGAGRTRWTARIPKTQQLLAWEAETTAREEPERLAWRSLPGSDLDQEGEVRFRRLNGRATEVHLRIAYQPPVGPLTRDVLSYFRAVPEQVVQEDLRRFKHMVETGEIPTVEGQPVGGVA